MMLLYWAFQIAHHICIELLSIFRDNYGSASIRCPCFPVGYTVKMNTQDCIKVLEILKINIKYILIHQKES